MTPRRLLPGLVVLLAALLALPARSADVQHGADAVFRADGLTIVWAVARHADETKTAVVVRIVATDKRFAAVEVDGIDPFTKATARIAPRRTIGAGVDVVLERARFADLPQTEFHFVAPTGERSLTVYYLGVPDTTPEFADEAKAHAYFDPSDQMIPRASGRQDGDAPLMLFDGMCNFCSGSARFVLARSHGRPLRFCAMQTETGQAWLRHLGLKLDDYDTMALVENGTAHVKSAAVLRIAAHMDAPWPQLATLLRLVPRPVRDWAYDRVAANRFRLAGRRNSCMMPDAETRARFAVDPPA